MVRSLALLTLLAACSPSPFQPLSLDAALARAKAEDKVVFVDFSATWCGPCQRMLETTFRDARVREWLQRRTVPIQVDIDAEPALAREFHIDSVPTGLFLKPDRSPLGSLVGYRSADQFVQQGANRLRGLSEVDEVAADEAGGNTDVDATYRHFDTLLHAGKDEQALAKAEDYWQRSRGTAHAGVRGSFFLMGMQQLASRYKPAQEAMDRWLQQARTALARGGDISSALEVASLCRVLKQPKTLVEVLQQTKDPLVRRAMASIGSEQLLQEHQYQLLVDSGVCDRQVVQEQIDSMREAVKTAGPLGDEYGDMMRRSIVDMGAHAFEALSGAGKVDDAMAMADLLLGGRDDGKVRERLAKLAEATNQPRLAARLRAK